MDIVASTPNTQQTNPLILACLCEHDRTTVVYRTIWDTVFRPIPSPLRLFPGVTPYYLEYQRSSSGPRRLNPLTDASISRLTVTSINPLLHGLLLVRDANSPGQWNLATTDGRPAQIFSRFSQQQLTQNLSTATEQQPVQSSRSATQQQLVQNLGGIASQQVPPSSSSNWEQQLVQNSGSTSAQSLAQSSSSTSEQQLVQVRDTSQLLDEMFSTPSDRPFAQSNVSPTWDQYLAQSSNSTSEQQVAQSTDSNLTNQELAQMLSAISEQPLAHSNVGTSEQQLVQSSNSTTTQAATAPAADADGDALFTGPTSSPSSTSSHVSNDLSCSELLAVLARDDPDVMAKGLALGADGEAREARERQEELDREAQPGPAHAPEVEREPRSSTRLMAPNATTTERSRSRSAYSSGDNSSGNDATGTNATASMEASASSLATIASYTSNGSPVVMEPWALNTDSPAASLHLVPPPSANRPCPLQPYIDEVLRHHRSVNSVSFNRGLQNLMSPDGRTPEERERRHEEIEQRQMRFQEEMRSNRVALSHLPSLGAPGPSRRSGNEGDDERNSQSSKETTTSESSGAAESEKENVSNDKNRQEDEENQGLGPSGTIRGRKGKGKERQRSDDDDDDEKKKGESSFSPGKRRKTLPLWDGQK